MIHATTERLTGLMRFIRSQMYLTNANPPRVGPGEVRLNHEEAALAASAIESEVRYREALATATGDMRELLSFAEDEWLDASEAVAMGGGTGPQAGKVLADSLHLRRMCTKVDRWNALTALLRQKIERSG